jgi:HSP20 family protein
VDRDEIELDLEEDILTVDAEHDELKYHKEILLPRSYERQQMHTSCRNGVLEIQFTGEEDEEEKEDS